MIMKREEFDRNEAGGAGALLKFYTDNSKLAVQMQLFDGGEARQEEHDHGRRVEDDGKIGAC